MRLSMVLKTKRMTRTACVMLLLSQSVHSSSFTRSIAQPKIPPGTANVIMYYNDVYRVTLPPKHRFPMEKYQIIREAVQTEYDDYESVQFQKSPTATRDELVSTHCPTYVDRYLNGKLTPLEVRKTGFPWSLPGVERSLSSVGGTVAAMRTVMTQPNTLMTGHFAGGTHHAFYDYGEGFCIFSDIAVACNLALKEFPDQVKRILILDLDVHQGNGNAALFQHDPRVFTFSMHCRENYFSAKQQSNIDIELDAGTDDEVYLSKLKTWLPYLFHAVKPQLVFYQAGVDIYEGDRLGKLKVTRAGLQKRNEMIYQAVSRRGIKCVVTMGGGYPKDLNPDSTSFKSVIECHADVYRACINCGLGATGTSLDIDSIRSQNS